MFFFYTCRAHPNLHSFPTRRSSDLVKTHLPFRLRIVSRQTFDRNKLRNRQAHTTTPLQQTPERHVRHARHRRKHKRSEEHTSELQSQFHLVCRLLLEKNKQTTRTHC